MFLFMHVAKKLGVWRSCDHASWWISYNKTN